MLTFVAALMTGALLAGSVHSHAYDCDDPYGDGYGFNFLSVDPEYGLTSDGALVRDVLPRRLFARVPPWEGATAPYEIEESPIGADFFLHLERAP